MFTLLAIPWFVLQTTKSVTQTGITAFFSALSLVLSSFLSPRLVDRLGYKRTSVIGDVLSGVNVALVPLLYHTRGLAFWQLLVLVFLGGLLKSPGVTARNAMVPELAQVSGMRLEMVNALSDGISRVSRFIGAPLAGILMVPIGISNLLLFDGLSFVLSAMFIGFLTPATSPVVRSSEENTSSYFAALWTGLRFIRRDTLIFSMLLVGIITNLIDSAWSGVISPAFFQQVFHSPVFQGISIAIFIGTFNAMILVAVPLGTFVNGFVATWLGLRLTLMIMGALYLISTLSLLFNPALKKM